MQLKDHKKICVALQLRYLRSMVTDINLMTLNQQ